MFKKSQLFIVLLFSLTLIFLWMPKSYILAFYEDFEESLQNPISAGVLDFYFISPQDFTPEDTCDIATRDIQLFNNGNPFAYQIEVTEFSGDLCSYIVLTASLNGVFQCTHQLTNFTCQNLTFPENTNSQNWHFKAELTEGFPENSVCVFKLRYSGWQTTPDLGGGGFRDEEEVTSIVSSGLCQPIVPMLITKIYYDVDSNHGFEPANEWIELYNPNNNPIDITGWQICDNTSCDIIPASNPIPAHGFALISGDNSTWQYWEAVPSQVIKIVLPDEKIGNALANSGDRVILKDALGREIDAVSYGNDNYAFDPPCPDVAEGHILARVPYDIDTNTSADWKDLALPQVVVTYPSGGVWYCHQNVNLQWTATNPNGSNSDLSITLQYIRDLDDDGVISPGDGVTIIAQDIANSGSYNWQVSPCYYGYVWIRVIAKGPENFMVQASGVSGRVFEPPASEQEETPQNSLSEEGLEQTDENTPTDQESTIDTESATDQDAILDDTTTLQDLDQTQALDQTQDDEEMMQDNTEEIAEDNAGDETQITQQENTEASWNESGQTDFSQIDSATVSESGQTADGQEESGQQEDSGQIEDGFSLEDNLQPFEQLFQDQGMQNEQADQGNPAQDSQSNLEENSPQTNSQQEEGGENELLNAPSTEETETTSPNQDTNL